MERNLVVEHGLTVPRPGDVPTTRPQRRVAVRVAGSLAAAVLGTGLAGCSVFSPATIATPYAAADGVEGSLTNAADGSTVDLRNMLIVGGDVAGPGSLIGTLTNNGGKPVRVEIGLTPASQDEQPTTSTVTVPANGVLQLGSAQLSVVLASVPAAGRMVGLTVRTDGGGVDDLTVPVMAAQGYYATLKPAPVATPTPTPVAPTPSGSVTPAPTPSGTDPATATNS